MFGWFVSSLVRSLHVSIQQATSKLTNQLTS